MSSRTRTAAAVGVVLMLGVAAVLALARGGAGHDSTPSSNVAPPATASGLSQAADAAPALNNTGEDYEAIYRSLDAFSNWVFQHPDPALVDRYALPSCSCYRHDRDSLAALAKQQRHLDGPGGRLTQVVLRRVAFRDTAGQATTVLLYVVSEGLDVNVVDSAGRSIQHIGSQPGFGFLDALYRDTDGRWRIGQRDRLGPPGDTSR